MGIGFIADAPAAIQTRYKGFHFRSRLEARWAVFFDHLGIKWEYEKEGYDFSAEHWNNDELNPKIGRYLPDFWLPQSRTWIEVKGSLPETHWAQLPEERKIEVLVQATKARQGLVVFGLPSKSGFVSEFTNWGEGELVTRRWACGVLGEPAVFEFLWRLIDERVHEVERLFNEAEGAAKSARFEHGQRGAK